MPYPEGTCKGCGGRPQPGATRCEPCAAAWNAAAKKRRTALKQAGRCVVCARSAARAAGRYLTVCRVHREYYRRRAPRAAH